LASAASDSAVPTGLVPIFGGFPRTYVRGFIMPSLRDWGGDE
jgi:hypothetical protein